MNLFCRCRLALLQRFPLAMSSSSSSSATLTHHDQVHLPAVITTCPHLQQCPDSYRLCRSSTSSASPSSRLPSVSFKCVCVCVRVLRDVREQTLTLVTEHSSTCFSAVAGLTHQPRPHQSCYEIVIAVPGPTCLTIRCEILSGMTALVSRMAAVAASAATERTESIASQLRRHVKMTWYLEPTNILVVAPTRTDTWSTLCASVIRNGNVEDTKIHLLLWY